MGSAALPLFAVPFSGCLVTLFILERVVHVILMLLFPEKQGPGDDSMRLVRKDMAARGVVDSLIGVVASAVFTTLNLITNALRITGSFLVWFIVVFVVLSLVWVTYEEYPVVWLHGVSFYNSRLGPIIHTYMIVPLRVAGLFGKALLPIYDGIAYVATYLFTHGLFPLMWDQTSALVEMVLTLLHAGRATVVSVQRYKLESSCGTIDECMRVQRDLDLLTPLDSVRSLGTAGVSLFGNVCGLFRVPVQLLLYPLLDHSFASSLHNLLNAVLHLFVQAPALTVKRSVPPMLGNGLSALQTTPDLQPVWSRLAAAVSDLGDGLDNWIGACVTVALHGTVGENETTTTQPVHTSPIALESGAAVVGLTNWLMASSNGTHAAFSDLNGGVTAPVAWPTEVDTSFGLAGVRYSLTSGAGALDPSGNVPTAGTGGRHTPDIMGCRCGDSSEGIRVTCAILQYAPGASGSSVGTHVFDVPFQDNTWVTSLSCAGVEISVRSVRWPVTRYEGATIPFAGGSTLMPTTDCVTRGTCESIDATIWLVPKCSSPALAQHPALCSLNDVQVGTNCFPYCMAARLSDSANQAPIFTNAHTWRTGKQLVGLDCLGVNSAASSGSLTTSDSIHSTGASMLNPVSAQFPGASSISPDGRSFVTSSAGPNALGCTRVQQSGTASVVSWVHNPSESVSYVRATGQPFAITGDTLLTVTFDN